MASQRTDDYDIKDPAKWLHAEALGGKAVTMRIRAVGWEEVDDHHGKVEERLIFDFDSPSGREIKPRYLSSPTNGRICRHVFGRYWNDWVGHLITLAPEKSAIGESGLRIAFIGSPDIEREMSFKVPGFKVQFKKTPAPKGVDRETGEIIEGDAVEETFDV
jgi:hypothetical protein